MGSIRGKQARAPHPGAGFLAKEKPRRLTGLFLTQLRALPTRNGFGGRGRRGGAPIKLAIVVVGGSGLQEEAPGACQG